MQLLENRLKIIFELIELATTQAWGSNAEMNFE